MYARGHVGVGLLIYAPILAILLAAGDFFALAVVGWGLTVFHATLPDIDIKIPGIPHRGPTHTLWFAVLVGIVNGMAAGIVAAEYASGGGFASPVWSGQIGSVLAPAAALAADISPGLVGLFAGCFVGAVCALAIVSHILGDVLTPMGVRPFTPFSSAKYTINVTKAANRPANALLHYVGQGAVVAAIFLGSPQARRLLFDLLSVS